MLTGISKKIELAANVAIVIVACLLAIVLIKSYLLTNSEPRSESELNEAQTFKQPAVSSLNIDWRRNGQTLLLAVSSNCRFCTESAPFYRKLAERKHNARLVVISPQPVAEGREYLEQLGVYVDEIKQLPLDKLGVTGTPTLIVVDSSGAITRFWTGKLSPEQEAAVLGVLGIG
jgi:thioredoxin-related protein